MGPGRSPKLALLTLAACALSATLSVAAPLASDTKVRNFLLARRGDEPMRLERLLLASGALILSGMGVVLGAGAGYLAYQDYRCLRDIAACNSVRPDDRKIEGTQYLALRAEGERKAVLADMGWLLAVTSLGVAASMTALTFWPAAWWPLSAGSEKP